MQTFKFLLLPKQDFQVGQQIVIPRDTRLWENKYNGEPWVQAAHLPFRFRLLLPFTQLLVLSELLQEISALIQVIGAKLHYPTPQAITLL